MLIRKSLACLSISFASTVNASIIINEIMKNPSAVSDSSGEWFELYNTGSSSVDLNGWSVRDNGFDYFEVNQSLVIEANSFLVFGSTGETTQVDYQYGPQMFLANGDDEILLFDSNNSLIDSVEYEDSSFPDPNGASFGFTGDKATDNGLASNWSTSTDAFYATDLGTPGACNEDIGQVCTTNPQVIINEIMKNPSEVFDSKGEWFELFNPGSEDIDLLGWSVADAHNDSFVIDQSVILEANSYVVLGNTNETTEVDYQYGAQMFLSNSTDEILLFDPNSILIDSVEYDDLAFPDPNGASFGFIGGIGTDNAFGENWDVSTTSFHFSDRGTPGLCNADIDSTCPNQDDNVSVSEPMTWSLLLMGMAGLIRARSSRYVRVRSL